MLKNEFEKAMEPKEQAYYGWLGQHDLHDTDENYEQFKNIRE